VLFSRLLLLAFTMGRVPKGLMAFLLTSPARVVGIGNRGREKSSVASLAFVVHPNHPGEGRSFVHLRGGGFLPPRSDFRPIPTVSPCRRGKGSLPSLGFRGRSSRPGGCANPKKWIGDRCRSIPKRKAAPPSCAAAKVTNIP